VARLDAPCDDHRAAIEIFPAIIEEWKGVYEMQEVKGSVNVLWLVPMIFLLLSCASKPDIIGTWREVGKVATIEFSRDGTFKAVDNQGMAVSGQYTLSEDGDLRCEIEQNGGSQEVVHLTISIRGDELTLASPGDRDVERYRRER